jgi:hypothetical protein
MVEYLSIISLTVPSLSTILSFVAILIVTSNHAVIERLIYSKKVFYGINLFALVMVIWTVSEFLHETHFYVWLRFVDTVLITLLIIYGLLWVWKMIDDPAITINRDFREVILSVAVFWLFLGEIKNYVSTRLIENITVTLDFLVIPLSIFLLIFTLMYLNQLLKGNITVPMDTVPFFLGTLISFALLNSSFIAYLMGDHFQHYMFDFGAIIVFLYYEIKYVVGLFFFLKSGGISEISSFRI